MKRRRRVLAAACSARSVGVAVFLLSSAIAGCSTLNYENVPVRRYSMHRLSMPQVAQAIRLAADRTGWQLKQKKEGVFIATREHSDQRATCEVHYSPSAFSIIYVASQNLRVRETAASLRKELHTYNTWGRALNGGGNGEAGNPYRSGYEDWAFNLQHAIEEELRREGSGAGN